MATAIYPATLPYVPEYEGYQMSQRHQPLSVTEMEDGPRRQRSSSSSVWSQHAYSLAFTTDQFTAFDAFVKDVLVNGAARFYMPVARLQAPTPWFNKLVYLEGGAFTAKPLGRDMVMVSFTLNVLDW